MARISQTGTITGEELRFTLFLSQPEKMVKTACQSHDDAWSMSQRPLQELIVHHTRQQKKAHEPDPRDYLVPTNSSCQLCEKGHNCNPAVSAS